MADIKRIDIEGFGILRKMHLELVPGLNILYGQNEAGKTTLMHFIRAILFGFEARNSSARYEPVEGGRHGGRLVLSCPNGEYVVERLGGGRTSGELRVLCPDGQIKGDAFLTSLLGGVSETLFKNVFAFGLDELQRLDTLKSEEVSGHIYSAGLGLGKTSIIEADSVLAKEMDSLFRPRGSKPLINTIIRELNALETRIRSIQRVPEEYNELKRELGAATRRVSHLVSELESTNKELAEINRLIEAWPTWEDIVRKRRLLSTLPDMSFPVNGSERLNQHRHRLEKLQRAIELCRERIAKLEEKDRVLEVDTRILECERIIKELADKRYAVIREMRSIASDKAALARKSAELKTHMDNLGDGWGTERILDMDCSVGAKDQVRQYRDRLLRQTEDEKVQSIRVEDAAKDLEEKRKDLARRELALAQLKAPSPPTDIPFTDRERSLSEAISISARVQAVEAEIRHQRERLEDVELQAGQMKPEPGRRKRPSFLPSVLSLVLTVAFGVGLLIAEQLTLPTAIVLVLLNVFVLAGEFLRKPKDNEQVNRLHQTLSALSKRRAEIEALIESCSHELASLQTSLRHHLNISLGIESADEELLKRAREDLETERDYHNQRHSLEDQIREALQRVVDGENDLKAAQAKLIALSAAGNAIRDQWQKWLKERHFPEVSPEGALEIMGIVERARGVIEEIEGLKERLKKSTDTVGDYTEGINRVRTVLNMPEVSVESAPDSAAELMSLLEKAAETKKAKKLLGEEIAKNQEVLDSLTAELDDERRSYEALLSAGGAQNEEEFLERESLYLKRSRLQAELIELEGALALFIGSRNGNSPEESLSQTDLQSLRFRKNEVEQKAASYREELDNLTARIGALRGDIARHEKADELSKALLERNMLLARLQDTAQQWAVAALSRFALSQARMKYEKERQPAVLKLASQLFSQMTGGRYTKVIAPLGERHLKVVSRGGHHLSTDHLSRGTAEQLYLAMRLALVDEYSKHSANLPLVMDDILVNFDPKRLLACVEVLGRMSAKNQMLLFTCHPHIVEATAKVCPGSQVVALRPSGESGAEAEVRRESRRTS